MSSGKTRLMVGVQKEQALVSRGKFCAASDQSRGFLSHMGICRKNFSPILHNLKTFYEYKHMKKGDLGNHC